MRAPELAVKVKSQNNDTVKPSMLILVLIAALVAPLNAIAATKEAGTPLAELKASYQVREYAEVSIRGHWVQGGMVIGQAPPAYQVRLNDQDLLVSDQGVFVFGFDRDGQSGDVLTVIGAGKTQTYTLEIASRRYDIQRIEGIKKKHMQPSAEQLKRTRAENAMVGKARKDGLMLNYFQNPFIWPVKGPITGVFGSQRVYNGEPRRPHYGVDVAAPTGAEVIAPIGGKVTLAHPDMFYSGGTLILDHGHGISSTFLHLHKLLVKQGDWVKQTWPIAQVGATGRVTGAHLDWRMNWFKRRIDPALLVPDMQDVLKAEAATTP